MRKFRHLIFFVTIISFIAAGCKSMNKSQKGAVIGAAGGAVAGAVIGKAAGNAAMGAIIGATVGGVAGAIIGRQMDKQAKEIAEEIPDAKVERVGEGIVVEFNSRVLFGFDQSDLNSTAKENLDNLVKVLKKYPDTNIEIQGHTDNVGTDEYNQGLSERRAMVVTAYLRNAGIDANRVHAKGFGENAPKYSNETEEGRAMNRRVDFLITANEKMVADAKKEAGEN